MAVKSIMNSRVVTVELDDSLAAVKHIFDHVSFHHLLVVEKGTLFGVISDRDLLRAISPNVGTESETLRDSATLNKRVHQILTRQPITLLENAGVYDAIEVFNTHNISCIPIVDEEGKPVGIISWRDILKAIEVARNQRVDGVGIGSDEGHDSSN